MRTRTHRILAEYAFFLAASGVPAWTAQSAQNAQARKPEFEVASVKPSGPLSTTVGIEGKIIGGPGTADPIQLRGKRVTLFTLIRTAYDLNSDQLSGPGWMQDDRYDITAKIPQGSTKGEIKLMLQNLLADRFRLTIHREPKEFPVYELTVAKGGSRLKPTAYPDATPLRPWESTAHPNLDADGYPVMPAGRSGAMGDTANGVVRWTFQSLPVSDLIRNLESNLGSPLGPNTWAPGRVLDKTGLTGKYDFKIAYAGTGQVGDVPNPPTAGFSATQERVPDVQDPGGGPDLFRALEKQLGLTLTKKKAVFDLLVVDHADRVPTEN